MVVDFVWDGVCHSGLRQKALCSLGTSWLYLLQALCLGTVLFQHTLGFAFMSLLKAMACFGMCC